MLHASSYLSVSQFAAREGVSRPRVLQWLAAQRITGALRVGHQWAIPATAAIERRAAGRPGSHDSDAATRLLRVMAKKYLWWLAPAEAAARPDLIITQVMDIGDYEDVCKLESEMGRQRLVRVLRRAEAGRLSERSWNYWHHRLGLVRSGRVPASPRRVFA